MARRRHRDTGALITTADADNKDVVRELTAELHAGNVDAMETCTE